MTPEWLTEWKKIALGNGDEWLMVALDLIEQLGSADEKVDVDEINAAVEAYRAGPDGRTTT